MEVDVSWKEFFQDDARYADVINALGCGGRQVVTKEDLQEADTQTILGRVQKWPKVGRSRSSNGKYKYRLKLRDMVRKVAFGVNFVIVGIENQELINYAAPLSCMVYDAGEYEKQLGQVRKLIRKNAKGLTAGEYLYGFGKKNRLFPVVTFVLYAGAENWDGPTNLCGMLDFTGLPEELKNMVSDYSINLVEIRKLKDTSVFKTDVRQVFDFIRYSEDKEALKALVQNEEAYQNMEEDAYEVAAKYMNVKELFSKKEKYRGKDGKVNMCKAMQDWSDELLALGRKEGLETGRVEGHADGIRSVVVNMVKKGMDDEDIQELANCSLEMIAEVRHQYSTTEIFRGKSR